MRVKFVEAHIYHRTTSSRQILDSDDESLTARKRKNSSQDPDADDSDEDNGKSQQSIPAKRCRL